MSSEREGAWQSNAQKIRVDGTEKKRNLNECISCTFWCMYWAVEYCTSRINNNINTRYLEVYKKFILTKRKSQLHSPNHWKHWMMTFDKNDVSGSSIVPNHWNRLITAFHQDVTWYVCQSLVGITTMYITDYIHLSTTKYQPEMPDYVNNNNISGTS